MEVLGKSGGASIRLHDVVKRFNGAGGVDVATWLRQLRLVARLQGLDDLAMVLPLFLDGAALAVYEQMDEAARNDITKIEDALITAFGLDRFQAFEEFRVRIRQPGEPVDVFMSELRRLADLAGVCSDDLLCSAFVVGLPRMVSTQLRATPGISTMAISEVVNLARALMSEQVRAEKAGELFVAAAADKRVAVSAPKQCSSGRTSLQCFQCGGPHLKRFCPRRVCFRCGESGHHVNACSAAGNGKRESHAPERSL